MKHYHEAQWQAFRSRILSQSDKEAMESHLLECEDCLNLFLSLTDEMDVARAGRIIPPEFSRKTVAHIHHGVRPQPGYVPNRNKIKRLMSYYVTASVITLILAGSGFFDKVADHAMRLSTRPAIEAKQPDSILFTWPDRLVKTSSYWTQLIPQENINLKEVTR